MANGNADDQQKIRELLPVDLIAEVVETRYGKRQRATVPFWATTTISIVAILVTVGSTAVVIITDDRSRDRTKAVARLLETPSQIPSTTPALEPGPPDAQLPNTQGDRDDPARRADSDLDTRSYSSIRLLPGGSQYFTIAVPESGAYVINAQGVGDFDPVITLYRVEGAGLYPIASNDDAEEGLPASSLRIQLNNNIIYQLEVRELLGNPGTVGVSLREARTE